MLKENSYLREEQLHFGGSSTFSKHFWNEGESNALFQGRFASVRVMEISSTQLYLENISTTDLNHTDF